MANEEHLARLQEAMALTTRWREEKRQQVVTAWNQWRKENPHIQPDLSRVDFEDSSSPAWTSIAQISLEQTLPPPALTRQFSPGHA
jgi:hypothetical protein